jgi:Ca-activated chloride channel family protein
MDRENRLALVKRALGLLIDELRPDDRLALAVYGSEGRILLHPTRDHAAIRAAIAELQPSGSTNAEAGLQLGYQLADEAWVKGDINRVILCSDGVANVGATGPESILARIGEQARRGIQLTTVGFGMGNYNDALMERLANQGDGTYHYVDEIGEARRVFVENLTGTLQNVAKDAKIQVVFDPRVVDRWRLLGYENRDVADRDFRNDAVDAGEVGAGQAATALYEVRLRPGVRPGDRIATLQVRWKSIDARQPGEVRELAKELRVADVGRRLDRASRDLRLAAVAASFAEKLKGTRAGQELRWPELSADADDLVADFPRDAQARDLAALVDRAARLAGEHGRHHRERSRDDEDGRRDNGRLDED